VPKLGVNIDHVATLRQARRISYPEPVRAAKLCEDAGCNSIVCHLREDRRHINDDDLLVLRKTVKTMLNLEMCVSGEIVDIACKVKPEQATLVPEKREEITTEGGLDVISKAEDIKKAVDRLKSAKIAVSLFIDPDEKAIRASKSLGVSIIELHTGQYANAETDTERNKELDVLKKSTQLAMDLGLVVNAGHGLNYKNVTQVSKIKGVNELNIGHAIVSHAVFVGLKNAVEEMKRLIS